MGVPPGRMGIRDPAGRSGVDAVRPSHMTCPCMNCQCGNNPRWGRRFNQTGRSYGFGTDFGSTSSWKTGLPLSIPITVTDFSGTGLPST